MKCVVAIDLPLLTAVDCSSAYLAYWRLEETTDIIHEVSAGKGFILFRDALYEMLFGHGRLPELFWKEISNVNFEPYQDDGDAAVVLATPNVVDDGLAAKVKTEMKTQLVAMHKQEESSDTAYIIELTRGFGENDSLETTIKASTRKHDLLNVSGGKTVKEYFQKFHPVLVQLKHHQFAYKIDGKDVSPFSAFDPNDTKEAEGLLAKAMDDYEGVYTHSNPPDALYTWDAVNRCYVCFHHSGNWEYHGFDLQSPYTEVPQYIKQKYHIEK